jgi:heavy metal sensor kinase
MFNSVRARLTVWYTAMLTFVLLVFAGVTYFLVQRNSMHRTDSDLVQQADAFLLTVDAEAHEPDGAGSVRQNFHAAIVEHRFRDTLFVVTDQKGALLEASESDTQAKRGTQQIWQPNQWLKDADAQSFQTLRTAKGRFRKYVRPFSINRENYSLVVLQSLHPQQEFLETLAGSYSIVIPLAMLLAGIGGSWLARSSLNPVAAMAAQASSITADNLQERLAVRNPRDEVGQLAQSFNDLLDRLERSFELERRFIADASHELRTPVAILCGEADVALSRPNRAAGEYRESLEILRTESRRLKSIIEDLFTLARADAGQHRLVLSKFYLDELVAECARGMRSLAAAKNISLHSEAGTEMPVEADESLLRRMLINVLDNAVKYTPEGGSVMIACEESATEYCVVVRDSGPGIPPEAQPRIFERFFRGDKARSRSEGDGGGAGLGLAISLLIAEAHGGDLTLAHSDSQGSNFTISLPKSAATSLIPRLSSAR